MSCCCSDTYNVKFDLERAEAELSDYREIGPRENSKPLVAVLNRLPLEGLSLLDIGGGVGVIFYELRKKGITKVTHLDISKAYVDVFRAEVERLGIDNQTISFCGDFIEIANEIPTADLVVLDKVICCFEDYKSLVQKSVVKSNRFYAFSVPKWVWWVRAGHALQQWWKRKQGDDFRTYVHSVPAMEKMIEIAGFKKIIQEYDKEWTYLVFEKNKSSWNNS